MGDVDLALLKFCKHLSHNGVFIVGSAIITKVCSKSVFRLAVLVCLTGNAQNTGLAMGRSSSANARGAVARGSNDSDTSGDLSYIPRTRNAWGVVIQRENLGAFPTVAVGLRCAS